MNAIEEITKAVAHANGRRRERTVDESCIEDLCLHAIKNPGSLIIRTGGTVPNSYKYPAYQTVFAVTAFRGLLYYSVGIISASKGSSQYTWFGGHGKHSERENAKSLRTSSTTKRVKP